MEEIPIRPAPLEVIEEVWNRWGVPIVSIGRHYMPADVEGLFIPGGEPAPRALVTWAIDGAETEIVTLDAFEQGHGHGSRVLADAERLLASRGVSRIRLMTTSAANNRSVLMVRTRDAASSMASGKASTRRQISMTYPALP